MHSPQTRYTQHTTKHILKNGANAFFINCDFAILNKFRQNSQRHVTENERQRMNLSFGSSHICNWRLADGDGGDIVVAVVAETHKIYIDTTMPYNLTWSAFGCAECGMLRVYNA